MGRKSNAEKAKVPALDLSALTVSDAAVPTITRTTTAAKDNPFIAHLQASYDSKTGKSVTVPEANADEVMYLVRQASNALNIGARVVKSEPVRGKVTVTFAGKDRRKRRTKEEIAAAAAAEAKVENVPANA